MTCQPGLGGWLGAKPIQVKRRSTIKYNGFWIRLIQNTQYIYILYLYNMQDTSDSSVFYNLLKGRYWLFKILNKAPWKMRRLKARKKRNKKETRKKRIL
ncbi:hypothetical protein Y1Q_0016089 [Alligator mississippiensis]|uniref:Uncharacterized protein n=1 Tax=Alligator mississippiensis TaxID=8496 RepID=A0A151P1G8_ALLMI|nr:hypothetical protein Y1Q_0016089 [Alligator mississippiensis]